MVALRKRTPVFSVEPEAMRFADSIAGRMKSFIGSLLLSDLVLMQSCCFGEPSENSNFQTQFRACWITPDNDRGVLQRCTPRLTHCRLAVMGL